MVLLKKNDIGFGASCRAAGQISAGGVTDTHLQILNKGLGGRPILIRSPPLINLGLRK